MNMDDNNGIYADSLSLTPLSWACAMCGEVNETMFDPSGGMKQRFVEDCSICCHPNVITIRIDPATSGIEIYNEIE